MSVRQYAAHLGVSDRMVSKWEVGGDSIQPNTVNQRALDTSLATASTEAKARFHRLVGEGHVLHVDAVSLAASVPLALRHPIDDKLMVMVEPGPYAASDGASVWLPGFLVDVHPVSVREFAHFTEVTGHDAPVQSRGEGGPVLVRWPDALAYCRWASKSLPTPVQHARATTGDAGVMAPEDCPEWTLDPQTGMARRLGGSRDSLGAFRTVITIAELLAIVAV
jgi:hypothetical protein